MSKFDRYWILLLITVGAYVVTQKIADVYFWFWNKSFKAISEYHYLTDDRKVIAPKEFDAEING